MTWPAPEKLRAIVDRRLESLLRRTPDRLRRPLEALLRRRRYLFGEDSTAYFHPLAHPILELPAWVGEWAGLEPVADLVANVLEASLVGYLHVRLQDDLMDEALGDPMETMLLSDVLLTRHLSLLVDVGGDSEPLRQLAEQRWTGYAAAMLTEQDLHDPGTEYTESDFDRVMAKSQPLVLPSAALLARAQCWDRLDDLERFVAAIVRSAQLFNDLRDALRDREAGHFTWVVRRLGGVESTDALGRGIAAGFGAIIDEARADTDTARRVAAEMGLEGAFPWLAAREAAMDSVREELGQALFMAAIRAAGATPA